MTHERTTRLGRGRHLLRAPRRAPAATPSGTGTARAGGAATSASGSVQTASASGARSPARPRPSSRTGRSSSTRSSSPACGQPRTTPSAAPPRTGCGKGWSAGPQDDQEERERPGADPDRHRRPEAARTDRRRRAACAGHDGGDVLERRRHHGAQRADPRHPACRSTRPGRTQRRHARRHSQGAGRPAEQEPHLRAGVGAAGRHRGHADARLHLLCAWLPGSARKRPGNCAGIMWTSATRLRGRLSRRARRSGGRCGPTGRPRRRSRAGRWAFPQMAVDALRVHKKRQEEEQLAAGGQWSEHGLVFATRTGGALDAANVRREFKAACRAAKIGEHWTPRELRHSFVSLMSSSGVPVEEIARLAGHSNTRTTEVVYRRELRPVLTTGAEAMDRLFRPAASVRLARVDAARHGPICLLARITVNLERELRQAAWRFRVVSSVFNLHRPDGGKCASLANRRIHDEGLSDCVAGRRGVVRIRAREAWSDE